MRKAQGTNWVEIPQKQHKLDKDGNLIMSSEILPGLVPHQTFEENLDLKLYYNELDSGRYQLVAEIWLQNENGPTPKENKFSVFAEFDIP